MKIFPRWIATLLMLLISTTAFADSKEAAEAIESRYQTIESIEARFTQQTTLASLNRAISNEGVLYLKRPKKFRIDYTGQFPKQYISNGQKIWVYIPGDNQVTIHSLKSGTIGKETLAFITNFSTLQKNFFITDWPQTTPLQGHTYLILKPKSNNPSYTKLDCVFDSSHILKSVAIHNLNGSVAHYQFTATALNVSLPEGLFTFNKKDIHEVK